MVSDTIGTYFPKCEEVNTRMKEEALNVVRDFGGLFQSVMKEGALSVREKELIALGIFLTGPCVPCTKLHVQRVQKCLEAGATREQILEATRVAVVMTGPSVFPHVPEVIDALKFLGK